MSGAAAPTSALSRRSTSVAAVVIGVAVGLAYCNSFSGPFVFDDTKSIVGNASLLQASQWLHPPADLGVAGRPFLNLSLGLNFAWGGASVGGYHAVNLLIHLLGAWTLFGIARRTLRLPALQGAAIARDPERNAALIAVLWAVHPVQTSAVTYVIQRAESLMGLFYLLTLYAFIRAAGEGRIRWGWGIGSIAACALGMGTKEIAVTAPLIVLLYDRTFLSGSLRSALREHGSIYAGLGATWVLLGALIAGLPDRGTGYGYGVTAWDYALTESEVLVRYLGLALWPHPLVLDYNGPIITQLSLVLPYALAVVALLALGVWALVKRPVLGFVAAWFFIILAPTSSFVPVALQPMAENRLYLPLAAVVALVVGAGAAWLGRKVGIAAILVSLVFVGLTFSRNQDYRTEVGLWQDTVAKSPDNPRAQYNLGTVLLKAGQAEPALTALARARELSPADPEIVFNLAIALSNANRLEESAQWYAEAVRLRPNSAAAHNNFGIVLARLRRLADAEAQFAAAVQLDPTFADAQANWGNALYQSGQAAEAAEHLAVAVSLQPQVWRFHVRLAMASAQAGHPEVAVREFEAALRIRPNDPDTESNLALVRAQVPSAGKSP